MIRDQKYSKIQTYMYKKRFQIFKACSQGTLPVHFHI